MEIKPDLKDKKLLYELDKDSRQTNKQIAKKVGLSEQSVGNRIKQLISSGVIEYFFVKTNPSLLGYFHIKVYLRLTNMTQKKEKELIEHLMKQKNIFWLASLRGKYDLVISMYAKNMVDFSEKYAEIFKDWAEYISGRNVVMLEKAFTYTKAYLLENKTPEKIVYSVGKEKQVELDKTDEKILRILNAEARSSLVEISNKINVSPDTVNYRINNLQKKGIITGFGVKIDFTKIKGNYYLLFLKLQNMNQQKYEKIQILAETNRNIIIFIKTLGDHDLEFEIETQSNEDLDKIIKLLRDNFTNEVKDYEILELTREHRITYFPF